jgi:hypothetical protein
LELNGIQLVDALYNSVELPQPERPAFSAVLTQDTACAVTLGSSSPLEAWESRSFRTSPLPPQDLDKKFLPKTEEDVEVDRLASILDASTRYRFGSNLEAAKRNRREKSDDWGLK